MADYISREIAMSMPWANGQYDHEHANEHFICGLETYKEWLEYVPAADVQPIMHGRWLMKDHKMMGKTPCCSECGKFEPMKRNFCPNCGADMRGE